MHAAAATYYRTRFPWDDYERLLSVPASPTTPALPTANRELSFKKGWRYISAEHASTGDNSIRKQVCTVSPQRIDIGSFYTLPIRLRRLDFPEFRPNWVELRFDIDITDYDKVRPCTGRQLCKSCIPLLVTGAKILDYLLETVYGFKDRLWCFSGGRGLHCWVLDPEAAFMSAAQRAELTEFFRIASLGFSRPELLDTLPSQDALEFAMVHLAKLPLTDCIESKLLSLREGPLGDRVKEFIGKLSPELSERCRNGWLSKRPNWEPYEDWRDLRMLLGRSPTRALIFGVMFPKIDYAVTRSINHMLRAPFSVREDNFNIVQPVDLCSLDKFDFGNALNAGQLDVVQFEASLKVFKAALRGRGPEAQYFVCQLCLGAVEDLNDLPRGSVFESSGEMAVHWQTLHGVADMSFDIGACTVSAVVNRLFIRNSPDQLGCNGSTLTKSYYYDVVLDRLLL